MLRLHAESGRPLCVGLPPSRIQRCLDSDNTSSGPDAVIVPTVLPHFNSAAPAEALRAASALHMSLLATSTGSKGEPSDEGGRACATVVSARVIELSPVPATQSTPADGSYLVKLRVHDERVAVAEAWVAPGTFGLVYVTGAVIRDAIAESDSADDDKLADQLKQLCLGDRVPTALAAEASDPARRVFRQKAYALLGIDAGVAASLWKLSPSEFSWWYERWAGDDGQWGTFTFSAPRCRFSSVMHVPGTVKLSYLAMRSCADRLRRQARYISAALGDSAVRTAADVGDLRKSARSDQTVDAYDSN